MYKSRSTRRDQLYIRKLSPFEDFIGKSSIETLVSLGSINLSHVLDKTFTYLTHNLLNTQGSSFFFKNNQDMSFGSWTSRRFIDVGVKLDNRDASTSWTEYLICFFSISSEILSPKLQFAMLVDGLHNVSLT